MPHYVPCFVAYTREMFDRMFLAESEAYAALGRAVREIHKQVPGLGNEAARIAEHEALIATMDESLVSTGKTALLSMNDLLKARERIAELEAALRPFAWKKDHPERTRLDDDLTLEVPMGMKHAILTTATVADCRRAATVLGVAINEQRS